MKIKPRAIIGLGNPGKEYEKTYHNAGFLTIDFFVENTPISNSHPPAGGLIFKPLKTDVFMNQSGSFVAKIAKKHKLKPEEILIIHDDSDIELGKYKISFSRGSAGHNGVESIIKALKTKDFWRLRIGIRPIKSKQKADLSAKTHQIKAGEFVLKKISKKDLEILEDVFAKALMEIEK